VTVRIATVVGARPQFIKASAISRAISARSHELAELTVHTGQHFDANMSDVFFSELDIAPPSYNLEISGGNHGDMTGRMLGAIEKVLLEEQPDWVLVYGDTNSTLAGALAAAKLHIPVAHVEAGLRSFNIAMPEEINRKLTDHISTLLFCPTETAVANLAKEGLRRRVHNVGDVMYDVALHMRGKARRLSTICERLGFSEKRYALATCHRAENTDDPVRFARIVEGIAQVARSLPVVFPLHPRTAKMLGQSGLAALRGVSIIEPVGYVDMVALEQGARVILTDSGGVQKEAFFYGIPCVTMRDETEWVETVSLGRNVLVGASTERIVAAVRDAPNAATEPSVVSPYGNGRAAEAIVSHLLES
jgi:UDP-GlcNAc3NAcA epimerase